MAQRKRTAGQLITAWCRVRLPGAAGRCFWKGEEGMSMWEEIPLTLNFNTDLCGGSPRYDKVVEDWVHRRAASEAALAGLENPKSLEEVVKERKATLDPVSEEDEMSKVWVGFQRDAKGLFIRGANLRAHLKDCASVLGEKAQKTVGDDKLEIQAFRSKFVNRVYVKENRLHILNSKGQVYKEPTSHRDATMTVMTRMGPRTCLKRVDFCEPARICATILLLRGGPITRKHLKMCLEYGKVHGFGQDRSLQYGQYVWSMGEEKSKGRRPGRKRA